MLPNRPQVSVCVHAYNHAAYISQALESILVQEVAFDYEIIVSDDASTDGTREIIERYAQAHPDRFRLLLRTKNAGAIQTFFDLLGAARGTYIAWLDGDDHWLFAHKLQTQFDFLEAHPEFSLCFHNLATVDANGRAGAPLRPIGQSEEPPYDDLLTANIVPASAAMFRRRPVDTFPAWFVDLAHKLRIADWMLHLLNAEQGRMRYFDALWGAYRLHPGGLWTARPQTTQLGHLIEILDTVNRHHNYAFDRRIRSRISSWRLEMARLQMRDGCHYEALRSLYLGCRTAPSLSGKVSIARVGVSSMLRSLNVRPGTWRRRRAGAAQRSSAGGPRG